MIQQAMFGMVSTKLEPAINVIKHVNVQYGISAMIKKMPKQKPGLSKQDYCTPPEFLVALKNRLLIEEFSLDVAATKENSVAPSCITEEENALIQYWSPNGWNFCNPPYANIRPWVERAFGEMVQRGVQTAMLVPASVGANWWYDYVDGIAHVICLNGRLTFVGETAPYPKDCAVLLYTPIVKGGYEVWKWR